MPFIHFGSLCRAKKNVFSQTCKHIPKKQQFSLGFFESTFFEPCVHSNLEFEWFEYQDSQSTFNDPSLRRMKQSRIANAHTNTCFIAN